jgi:N-acetylmuramoyl-L-alanine amidase
MSLKQIQMELAKKKYPVGEADGLYGPSTERALMLAILAAPDYVPASPGPVASIKGIDFINLAKTRLGEKYVFGADVPLSDTNWHGPWDCAEFVTWVVYQTTGKIYGCINNNALNPEPYTGGWVHDLDRGLVIDVGVKKAAAAVGGILLRFGNSGKHIVFSQGSGLTVEAKGKAYGVVESKIGNLASWDYGIFIPGVTY